MKKWVFLCSATILLVAFGFKHVDAEEKDCKVLVGEITKAQVLSLVACNKDFNFKSGKEKAAKSGCALKCVGIKAGILDSAGKLQPGAVEAFIKKEIPANLQAKATELISKCEQFGGTLDPNEEFCKSYSPLLKCVTDASSELCK